jgi:hypothetical protein
MVDERLFQLIALRRRGRLRRRARGYGVMIVGAIVFVGAIVLAVDGVEGTISLSARSGWISWSRGIRRIMLDGVASFG